jgi:hypothetical protein
MQNDFKLIRYSQENPNIEALKGKYGFLGESWGSVTVFKNVLLVVANKGANVQNFPLPEVYDGFLITTGLNIVRVNNSTLNLSLAADECAQGVLKLVKDN